MSFNIIQWLQLNGIQEEQEQTNELLDKIWLQGLAPAERAREEAVRAKRAKSIAFRQRWGLPY